MATLAQSAIGNFQYWFERIGPAGGGTLQKVGRHRLVHWAEQNEFCSVAIANLTQRVVANLTAAAREFSPAKGLNVWLTTAPPAPLAQLICSGASWLYGPPYMSCDLQKLTEPPASDGVGIEELGDASLWQRFDHPYFSFGHSNAKAQIDARLAASAQRPQRLWHFVAWLNDKPVGHSSVLIGARTSDIAGIYDVGVNPEFRNRGIGAMITHAACAFARRRGAHHAVLSASPAGEPVYRRIGFERLAHGQTWQLHAKHPPITGDPSELVHSVVNGDLTRLNQISSAGRGALVRTKLTNGMMPLHLAIRLRQWPAADWMIEHGAPIELACLWEMGRKDQVRQLLRDRPDRANVIEADGRTLLHTAVLRNDLELAKVALSANPDLSVKDPGYQSTPLGWAKYFGRMKLAELIEGHTSA